ncbi:hypothetical protein [Erythrobacter mangrovi]|uniref:Molecular chaperone n=1 Tax=Erythrobacter mangrovi TaxID=2739433 RepID=A0A7D4CCB8_9SPHN|nr:hypothetical protein [Erythrobacter mangrovi]QKG70609.1 hypothetical protein HQR01_04065 [Erythrobacter mangrovi]
MNFGSKFPRRSLPAVAGALACLLALGPIGGLAQDARPAAAPPPAGSVSGFGDVNLFPKRVVLNGAREIANVGLYNKTTETGDYEIKIVDMAMTPSGNLVAFDNGLDDATKARVKVASPMLRYSPRRVTLRGSESQIVRILARADANLAPGEYRSHFMVTSLPETEGFSIQNAVGAQTPDGIGVTIRPRFGIAIPVILRIGATTLEVGITNATMLTAQDGSKAVAFTVTRSGSRSAFGDIVIKAAGASSPIAISKGVGIYPELDSRQVIVPIFPETDPRFLATGARLSIEFVDDDYAPGNKLAEHAFTVP